MRRIIAALAASTLAVGLPVALSAPAEADITAPANGAALRGDTTITSSGVGDGSLCVSGTKPNVTFSLINSGGTTVFTQKKEGTGAQSVSIDTHDYANGAYTVRTVEQKRSGTIICSNSSATFNRSVTIDNLTQLSYTGATEGAQNTSVTVKATLTDPNLAAQVLPNRTVTFSLSGGTSVSATTNASGEATAVLPVAGPPRSATVSASFAATTFYQGSTASTSFQVTKNPSTTTLLPPAGVVHGEPVSFTAQVTPASGNSDPGGTVQFTVDGDAFGAPVPVSGGAASTPPSTAISTGTHTVGATYSGDGNLLSSTATTTPLTVAKASTTTALSSTGSPTVSGEGVTFTAQVDVVAPGAGQPAGGVQFNVDGDPYGTAVPLSGDTAELTIANLPAGNHDVVATYNGNADFATSSSATITHGVNRADTALALSTSNANAVAGEPLTFTADLSVVAPGGGSPTGEVQFYADGEPIGAPVALSGSGSVVSPQARLDAGSHVISANYEGDDRFAGASQTLTQTVTIASTTTSVTLNPTPSVVGQPVTIKATVTPTAPATGEPQGVVQFQVDGDPLGFTELENGVAELSTSTLTRGSHQVKAVYFSSDPNFATSTSPAVSHTVNRAATKTTVTSSATPAVFGQPITFTATVSVLAPGAGSPSGTVTFSAGDDELGSVPVSSLTGGIASITVDSLAVGQHAITATYDGDDSFTASNGTVAQKVQRAQTSTLVDSSANPSQPGAAVRFTATVSPVAPGAGEPTGTIQFKVNGASLGAPVPLEDGVATSAEYTNLTPGTYRISAVYSGESRFVTSTGLLDQGNGQTVDKAGTSLDLAADAETSEPGQAVTFTATVQSVPPANGRPTGVVQFWSGDTLLGATGLTPAAEARTSVATLVTTSLAPGSHEVRAVYVGNATFDGSTAATSHVVNAGETVTGLESDANPASFGDRVTLTAVVADLTPAAGKPTGTVTFRSGDDVLGTASLVTVNSRQQAVLETTGLAVGEHAITATYSGDTSRSASTSPALSQTVLRMATRLEGLRVTKRLGVLDQVFATLKDANGTPLAGQRLVFRTGGTLFGSDEQPLMCDTLTDGNGVAACTVPAHHRLWVGSSGYDVFFAGNETHLPVSDHGSGK